MLPFATALAVYHFSPDPWFVWIAFGINLLVAIVPTTLLAASVLPSGISVGGAIAAFLVVGVPTGLNAVSFWLLMGRLSVARRAREGR